MDRDLGGQRLGWTETWTQTLVDRDLGGQRFGWTET